MDFKRINSITGWVVFAIASVVYLLTIEPTTSFWDCGEFITSAFKLEVGHPPGAPFFMLVARLFTLFAGGNVELAARMVNVFSALCSSFTILLLFWSITHLGRKLTGKASIDFTPVQTVSVIASGVVGALAYTFSDTFWFSAVEGEVYAFSSLFTALVFWAILRWEDEADSRYANRWLVLIAYLMGLSIGVHLLNLLAIPAIGLVYYHRKYPVTLKGTIFALLISAAILLVILYVIVPGVVRIAVWFELLFVKNMGLPMNTGIIIYALLLVGGIIFGLYYSLRNRKVILNNALLFASVIIIGYSSYAAIVIRSAAEPPMDQNDPQNLFNLQSYLNREQYGDRPLFYGPYYNSQAVDVKNTKKQYVKFENEYIRLEDRFDYVYKDGSTTLFPRMYSREPNHITAYKEWGGIPANQPENKMPTFGQNLRFFFSYQLGFMYFRYFFWNFVGRQNDIQNHGGPLNGNWLSGITALDEARLGPQDMPESLQNRGRNTYFFLPLILGLIGLIFQFQRNRPDFWVTMMLFIMTGIAIVVYLNQTPYQPRERDYAYAGSFYAFAIWIGLGVMAIIDAIPGKFRTKYSAIAVSLVLLLLVPGIMAKENWDDHDRSGRYTARDFGRNYLESCDENAIIFTYGDNDTFPLWYAQEVEGFRTDVRVVNLSYLLGDWYIDQMRRKTYESEPLPFSLTPRQYMRGTRDRLYIHDLQNGQYSDLKSVMKVIASEGQNSKGVMTQDGFVTVREVGARALSGATLMDFVPARNLSLPVDKEKVLRNGTVALKDSALIVPEVRWALNDENGKPLNHVDKNFMMMLDFLAHNDWDRPVYFAMSVPAENYLNLMEYIQLDGFANRLVPVKASESGGADADKLYDMMMNRFRWGNVSDPKVYLDETNTRMLTAVRSNFAQLARALISEGKKDSAVRALDKAYEVIPPYQLSYNYGDLTILEQYYRAGAIEQANRLANNMFNTVKEETEYYLGFPRQFEAGLRRELHVRTVMLWNLCNYASEYRQNDLFETFRDYWDRLNPGQKWEMMYPENN